MMILICIRLVVFVRQIFSSRYIEGVIAKLYLKNISFSNEDIINNRKKVLPCAYSYLMAPAITPKTQCGKTVINRRISRLLAFIFKRLHNKNHFDNSNGVQSVFLECCWTKYSTMECIWNKDKPISVGKRIN